MSTLERSKESAVDNDIPHDSEGVREMGREAVDCVNLAHDKCHWLADVNVVIERNVLQNWSRSSPSESNETPT